jgi:hypothetical protein
MKIVRYILNIVLAFLLVIVMIAVVAVHFVSTTILSKEYVLSKLEETEFYLQVSREVQSGFENYIYQSGLPEDTIDNLYTDEMIKEDVNSVIDYIYDGTEVTSSEEQVKVALDNKINEFLESEGKVLNTQGKENVEKFENLIVDEYKENITVSKTVYNAIRDRLQQFINVYEKVKNIPLIALAVIIVLLILINIKDLALGINSMAISGLSAGILLKLGVSVVFKNIDIDNLVLLSTSFTNLIISIIKEILYTVSDYGTYFIIIGATVIIITAMLRSTVLKKIRN